MQKLFLNVTFKFQPNEECALAILSRPSTRAVRTIQTIWMKNVLSRSKISCAVLSLIAAAPSHVTAEAVRGNLFDDCFKLIVICTTFELMFRLGKIDENCGRNLFFHKSLYYLAK